MNRTHSKGDRGFSWMNRDSLHRADCSDSSPHLGFLFPLGNPIPGVGMTQPLIKVQTEVNFGFP